MLHSIILFLLPVFAELCLFLSSEKRRWLWNSVLLAVQHLQIFALFEAVQWRRSKQCSYSGFSCSPVLLSALLFNKSCIKYFVIISWSGYIFWNDDDSISGKHRDKRFEPASLYCGLGPRDGIGLPEGPAQMKQENLAAAVTVFSRDSLHSLSKKLY